MLFPEASHEDRGVTVIKRDGTKAPLDINRIRDVVAWAIKGISGVNASKLEAKCKVRLRNGVTTREIQENLIQACVELATPQAPNWRFVAGRLFLWGLRKDATASEERKSKPYEYSAWAKQQLEDERYDSRLAKYSEFEIKQAESWLVPDRDLHYDYAGMRLWHKRYLIQNEMPQEAFLSCALLLALPEKPKHRLMWARLFYDALSTNKISLATPLLANLRVPNGSLSSCFIAVIDDSLKSIYHALEQAAFISQQGGGVGINISRVRAASSWFRGIPSSSGGVLAWCKLFNDTAVAVNQGGKRAGAITIGLDIWHLDIPAFLECQTEHGEQRTKCYDIFPQVVMPDLFIERYKAKQLWTLFDPYEVRQKFGIELSELWGDKFKEIYEMLERELAPEGSDPDLHNPQLTLYRRVKPSEIMRTILENRMETGMPYIAFKDNINKANPNKHEGYIPGVNLCCESYSNVDIDHVHCCNLVSIVLSYIEDDNIPLVMKIATRILDNSIDLTSPPIEEAGNHNKRYRTIGIGTMGLADWLAKRKLEYQAGPELGRLYEEIAYWAISWSVDLAEERGAYPSFPGSEWSKGNLIGCKPAQWFAENTYTECGDRWYALADRVKEIGIRNSHLLATAPNTSSGLIQAATAAHLPPFSRFFVDKNANGGVPIAPPFVEDYWHWYVEGRALPQQRLIEVTSLMQKYTDTGISMELLYNLNNGVYAFTRDRAKPCIRATDMRDDILYAWELGCKAIYYLRSIQRDSEIAPDKQECSSCAG